MDGRTLCVLKDTEKATGMSAACIGDGRDGAKSSQLEIQLFSPLILRPGCLSNLESKKANPCPDLAKDPPGVRSRRVPRASSLSPWRWGALPFSRWKLSPTWKVSKTGCSRGYRTQSPASSPLPRGCWGGADIIHKHKFIHNALQL